MSFDNFHLILQMRIKKHKPIPRFTLPIQLQFNKFSIKQLTSFISKKHNLKNHLEKT